MGTAADATESRKINGVGIGDIEVFADRLDARRAADIYREHGCLVVRGLMRPYLAAIQREIAEAVRQAVELLPRAKEVPGIGWNTPDGTLWLPAPANCSSSPRPPRWSRPSSRMGS